MARRFDQFYALRRGDNLGDPDWHNRRWDDIDRRMHARELDATKIDDAVDDLEAAALARLNDKLTPIIAQAITRLTDFGLLFSATSHTERTIQTGNVQFVVDAEMRESFVATGFLILRPTANLAVGMSARTLSYDPSTGVLTLDAYSSLGSGTYSEWSIGVTGDPDLSHATRTDNPHLTTAAQVGTYTSGQIDAAIINAIASEVAARNAYVAATIAALVNSAPGTLDTLNEIAAALANDPNFATTMTNALAVRVRFDQSQVLSQAQKQQVAGNIAGTAASEIPALDASGRFPRVDMSAVDGVHKRPEGRLMVSPGVPWPLVNMSTNHIYYSPHIGCRVPIYDPTYGGLRMVKFTSSDADVTGYDLNMFGSANFPISAIFDLWAALNPSGGALVVGAGPQWGNGAVGTAARVANGSPTKYQGVDVNAQSIGLRIDPTNIVTIPAGQATWVGTMRISGYAANTVNWWINKQINDNVPGEIGLWNRWNQKQFRATRVDITGSWTTAQTMAPANPAAGNNGALWWIDGLGNEPFSAFYDQYVTPDLNSSGLVTIGHNTYNAGSGTYGYTWPSLTALYQSQLHWNRTTLGPNFVQQVLQMITAGCTCAGGYPNNHISLVVDL